MPSSSIDFSSRAQLEEWMNAPCTYHEYSACIRDLERVNRLLQGYRPALDWLHSYIQSHPQPLLILDVGYGGGGLLRSLENSPTFDGGRLTLIGVDQNPYAERVAREASPPGSRIQWVT